ncbi:sirohydrochlorin ferrochelatase, chloroplastic [Selaginella moellendorffii]|nr:sirohydrochlorin ferrochelatase, chloroplastic [Selaginella moellendorffii]XP_024522580.1 sirohydrochlorin ferrochelatase, chloroplastic [Selaginella moellendorffii]|eukprot:XP_002993172.2 sirohydrochlorin ferrochelatase, chloroplastic [Selaginella moellendorffii]
MDVSSLGAARQLIRRGDDRLPRHFGQGLRGKVIVRAGGEGGNQGFAGAAVQQMAGSGGSRDGIVIVDHGSRRAESNSMLEEFVNMYKRKTGHEIVQAAHMELAAPSIEDAFDRCVELGAQRVIVSPYFLFPGRHWNKDIPALAAAASAKHPGIRYLVTAPIGLHELMVDVLEDRMKYCVSRAEGRADECDMCVGTGRCREIAVVQRKQEQNHQIGLESSISPNAS